MDLFKPREGTPAPYWRHMLYQAESVDKAFRSALADYISLAEDFFIDGAVISSVPSGTSLIYSITAGHICFKGELVPVAAHSITKLASQVVYLEIQDDAADVAPVLNLDGNTDYVLRHRHVRFRVGVAYPTVHMSITAPRKAELDRLRLKGRIVVPGMIVPYYGEMTVFGGTGLGLPNTVMDGWAVCNGLNGTPDMRGMVAMGATAVPDSGAPVLYAGVADGTEPGDKVGADKVTLDADQLPEHTHPITFESEQYPAALLPGGAGQFAPGSSHPYKVFPTATEVNVTAANQVEVRQSSLAVVWVMSIV